MFANVLPYEHRNLILVNAIVAVFALAPPSPDASSQDANTRSEVPGALRHNIKRHWAQNCYTKHRI